MQIARALTATLTALILGGTMQAADFSDPTWPCIQRKVGELSLGLMWPHPVPEGPLPDAIAEDATTLITALSLRRIGIDEARERIAAFAEAHPDLTQDDLGKVFRAVFDRVQRDRSAIISGIERYSLKQIALSEAIEDTRVRMDTLMKADAPDFDQVDELEEKLDWDERIFRDRAQSLTYVCETPVLLEQRIYAIGQALMAQIPQ